MQPLLPSAYVSPEEEREHIDGDIQMHIDAILALNSRRNRLAPISRLPAEIFSVIFLFVRAAYIFKESWEDRLDWIKVSHICKHWRNVALNSPTLWSRIPLESIEWTEEMLKRSKMANLTIIFDFRMELLEETGLAQIQGLAQAFKHGSRIRSLNIFGLTPDMGRVLEATPKATPQLTALRISGVHSKIPGEFGTGPLVVSQNTFIPDHVLTGSGKLRKLELTNCMVDWTSHLPNTITTLKLSNICLTTKPTHRQFMDALSRLPRLSTLVLHNAFPTLSSEHEHPLPDRLHFVYLRNLEISSTSAEVGAFFRHITFPPSAQANVACREKDIQILSNLDAIRDILTIPSDIGRSYLNSDLKVNILHIDNCTSHQLDDHIRFKLCVATSDGQLVHRTDHLDLSFMCPRSSYHTRSWGDKVVTSFFKSGFPLAGVSMLYLSESRTNTIKIKPETFARTVGRLPKVGYVQAGGLAGNSLVKALQSVCRKVTATETIDTYFFPNLSHIVFDNVSFTRQDTFMGLSMPHDLDIEQLEDCLIERYEENAEIEVLRFKKCMGMDKENVERLTRIVLDTYWDGGQSLHRL